MLRVKSLTYTCLMVTIVGLSLQSPRATRAQDLSTAAVAASAPSSPEPGPALQLEEPLPGRAMRGTGIALFAVSWSVLSLGTSIDHHGLELTAFVPLAGPLLAARETGRWTTAAFATVGQVLGLSLFVAGQVQRSRARRRRSLAGTNGPTLRVGAVPLPSGAALTFSLTS